MVEDLAVFAAFDGVEVYADDLDAVFVEDPGAGEGGGHVEAGLAAEVGQEGVGALFGDDGLKTLHV